MVNNAKKKEYLIRKKGLTLFGGLGKEGGNSSFLLVFYFSINSGNQTLTLTLNLNILKLLQQAHK